MAWLAGLFGGTAAAGGTAAGAAGLGTAAEAGTAAAATEGVLGSGSSMLADAMAGQGVAPAASAAAAPTAGLAPSAGFLGPVSTPINGLPAMTPAGSTLPGWAQTGVKAVGEVSDWVKNPGQKAGAMIDHSTSADTDLGVGKIIGGVLDQVGLGAGAQAGVHPQSPGHGPGNLTQVGGGGSQFQIGQDGLLHWTGAGGV